MDMPHYPGTNLYIQPPYSSGGHGEGNGKQTVWALGVYVQLLFGLPPRFRFTSGGGEMEREKTRDIGEGRSLPT